MASKTKSHILSALQTYHRNPKTWLAFQWLSTYPVFRPGDLFKRKEGDIDLASGIITIPHPKEGEPKIVPLCPEDVEPARKMMDKFPAFPATHFSGHRKAIMAALDQGCLQ